MKKSEDPVIIMVGDKQVGKTSIIQRLQNDQFNENIESNDLIINYKQQIFLDNKYVNFNIWDTPGDIEQYELIKTYIDQSDICIIVYDVTNRNSFNNIKYWLKYIEQKQQSIQVQIIIAGNKNDLIQLCLQNQEYFVEIDEVFAMVNMFKHLDSIQSKQISALNNSNVMDLFQTAIRNCINQQTRFLQPSRYQTEKQNKELLSKKQKQVQKNHISKYNCIMNCGSKDICLIF